MFIYIDESGTFAAPRSQKHSYTCAGALTISERRHSAVLKSFKTLKRGWGLKCLEVKGRDLNEPQIAQVIKMLVENNVKFHACATDMLLNSPQVVFSWKADLISRLSANLTDRHHPELVQQVTNTANAIRSMPDQLFLQLVVMIELVNSHLHDMMIHFAQQDPPELGKFRWIVDRKDKKITEYENTWRTLLPPCIKSRQSSDGPHNWIRFIPGGNYGHFKRFCKRIDKWPDHLPAQSPGLRERTGIEVMDINLVLHESFMFAGSTEKPGLQLADIITNALRRAMMGHLQHQGWSELGRLMFKWRSGCVRLLHFGNGTLPVDDDCARVLTRIAERAGFVV
jgi:hypothetical protein